MARPPFQAPRLRPVPHPITGDDGFVPIDLDNPDTPHNVYCDEENAVCDDDGSTVVQVEG